MVFQKQLLTVEIDGLNLGDKIFNYKNKLFFSHSKTHAENISSAFVLIDRPLSIGEGGQAWESEENRQRAKDAEDALNMISIFLACYNLVNEFHTLKIVFDSPSGFTINREEEIMLWVKSGGPSHLLESHKPKLSEAKTINSLNRTIPFFEKVGTIQSRSKKELNALQTALINFQRSIQNEDTQQDLLRLVTSIEAILGSKKNQRKIFASRASKFIESDGIKQKQIFDELYKLYKVRSKTTHGEITSSYPYNEYLKFKLYLEPIARKVLVKFIELGAKGKKLNEILKEIDKI